MMRAGLLPARWTGPGVIAGLAGAWAVLWFAAKPPGQPAVAYLGQFFGRSPCCCCPSGWC